MEFFPAVIWEDQDECLQVRPEDISHECIEEPQGRTPWWIKWAKRLGIGCGSLIALALVGVLLLNWGVKRLVVGKIESELESQGWRADVGDLNYSIANKEVEIRNFTGVPMDAKQIEEVGEVHVDHVRVRFDNSREDKLGELELRGANSTPW